MGTTGPGGFQRVPRCGYDMRKFHDPAGVSQVHSLRREEPQLFDFAADPFETIDLAHDPNSVGIRERMEACWPRSWTRTRSMRGPRRIRPPWYPLRRSRGVLARGTSSIRLFRVRSHVLSRVMDTSEPGRGDSHGGSRVAAPAAVPAGSRRGAGNVAGGTCLDAGGGVGWGYFRLERPETPELIWGMPAWVVWGLFVPWFIEIAAAWGFCSPGARRR
ncbi:MAG: hypothetical protein CM1200mP2_36290 [Planctomycetaceae bacterium]|nr:MAG: hypothetical protein CM1200mP2_36290 [Planctomycetaceae bacterium]